MKLEKFVSSIREIYGDLLESIILFGSAASGDLSKEYSDHNLILVLKQLSPVELKKASGLIKKWVSDGNSMPLFFDRHHIETSTDVFPIEFFDISSCRKVLSGSDPFANIKISSANLRHQCESELKGKLLQLRSRFAVVASDNKDVSKLMMESISSFLSVFKGVVRLVGHEPAEAKRKLVEQLAAIIKFSPNIFMELLDIRDGTAILPRKDALEKFEDYLEQIQTIANFVDRFEVL